MKKILFLLTLLTFLFSCEKPTTNVNNNNDDNNRPQELDSNIYQTLIIGDWEFWTGNISPIITPNVKNFHFKLTFIENGNFSEKNYTETSTYQQACEIKNTHGNWKINQDIIYINDWNGNITNTYKIISLNKEQLILENSQNRITLIRTSQMIENIKSNLIGKWYKKIFNEKEQEYYFYYFNSDNTGKSRSGLYFNSDMKWSLTNKILTIDLLHSTYVDDIFTITFSNTNYIFLQEDDDLGTTQGSIIFRNTQY